MTVAFLMAGICYAPTTGLEMTLKTEELACSMLTYTPEMIWHAVKAWCDNDHVTWHGLQQHQVCELVRKAQRSQFELKKFKL